MGGLFWKFCTTVNELDPNFSRLELDWGGGFSIKIRWSPKKKGLHQNSKAFWAAKIWWSSKKKGLHRKSKAFFGQTQVIFKKKVFTDFGWAPEPKNSTILVQITASSNPVGGAIFIFGAKIGLKSTENVLFCILFRPMGGTRAPPMATLLVASLAVACLRFFMMTWGKEASVRK